MTQGTIQDSRISWPQRRHIFPSALALNRPHRRRPARSHPMRTSDGPRKSDLPLWPLRRWWYFRRETVGGNGNNIWLNMKHQKCDRKRKRKSMAGMLAGNNKRRKQKWLPGSSQAPISSNILQYPPIPSNILQYPPIYIDLLWPSLQTLQSLMVRWPWFAGLVCRYHTNLRRFRSLVHEEPLWPTKCSQPSIAVVPWASALFGGAWVMYPCCSPNFWSMSWVAGHFGSWGLLYPWRTCMDFQWPSRSQCHGNWIDISF